MLSGRMMNLSFSHDRVLAIAPPFCLLVAKQRESVWSPVLFVCKDVMIWQTSKT